MGKTPHPFVLPPASQPLSLGDWRGKETVEGGAAMAVQISPSSTEAELVLDLAIQGAKPGSFEATVGCDRSFATCRDRFDNAVNFGGFPHMPGTDFAISYPNQGAGNDGGRRT